MILRTNTKINNICFMTLLKYIKDSNIGIVWCELVSVKNNLHICSILFIFIIFLLFDTVKMLVTFLNKFFLWLML